MERSSNIKHLADGRNEEEMRRLNVNTTTLSLKA